MRVVFFFVWHTHHDIAGVRPTHFALRPGGWRGERGERGGGRGFFGLTEEAVLLTSQPHQGAVLGFLGALPGTQCVPRQRLPARYRNEKCQGANQREDQRRPAQSGCRGNTAVVSYRYDYP